MINLIVRVHYQRFGEAMVRVQERLDSKDFYAVNSEIDKVLGNTAFADMANDRVNDRVLVEV